MQLAAAGNLVGIGILGLLDAQGNIRVQLLEQTVAQMAGGDIFSFLAG